MTDFELIAQGAEARLFKKSYLGRTAIVKERFLKTYRNPELDDNLTKERIKGEARAIVRAKAAGVVTPALYYIDFFRRSIFMEYIENSQILKSFIDDNLSGKENVDSLINVIGRGLGLIIGRLHCKSIIHGDLTTSNILVREISDDIKLDDDDEIIQKFVVIDFGLARIDSAPEDAAVDLYVLERSLISAHSELPSIFPTILKNYQEQYTDAKQRQEVLTKYEEVRSRGRKRLMVG